ncbi:sugar transferase [Candidatus Uhrbacteria bacterium]|nr:sugar transferase [Candidatus Uhrbacteria bacterium]
MKKAELFFTVIMVPVDFCLVLLAALTAYFWRFGWLSEMRPVVFDLPFGQFLRASLAASAIFVLFFAIAGLYTTFGPRRLKHEINRILIASAAAVMAVIAVVFFQREMFESRLIVIVAWALSFLYVSLGRIAVRLTQRRLLRLGVGVHRVAVIGVDNRIAATLRNEFAANPGNGYRIVRSYPNFDAASAETDEMAKSGQIDEIIVTDPEISRQELGRIFAFAQSRHLSFRYAANALESQSGNLEVGVIAGIPIVEVKGIRLDGWGRVFKRLFDIIVSAVMLVIVSPILAVTAIAVKLDSRGPVFWSELDDGSPVTRIGEHGKPFRYVKFRSMRHRSHNLRYSELADRNTRQGGPLVKIKDDPRITRVGRFIRRWSIDELPEIFLVLSGKMSLVGPRPHLPEEVDRYADWQRRVLNVKPGITGMGQVSGRSDLNFDEEARLDIWYMENWSPWLDLAILAKTPWAVIARRQNE